MQKRKKKTGLTLTPHCTVIDAFDVWYMNKLNVLIRPLGVMIHTGLHTHATFKKLLALINAGVLVIVNANTPVAVKEWNITGRKTAVWKKVLLCEWLLLLVHDSLPDTGLHSRSIKPFLTVMQMSLFGAGSTNVDYNGNEAKSEVCHIMAYAHSGPMYLAFRFQRLAGHWAGESWFTDTAMAMG